MNESEWKAPPELLRSVPRPTKLSAGGRVVVGAAVALVAGALASGIILYLAAARDAERLARIQRGAVQTEGEVIETRRVGGKSPQSLIIYRYGAAGEVYSGRTQLSRNAAAGLRPGSPVTVWYATCEPAQSWLPGHEPKGVPMWVAAVVPLGFLVGAASIAHSVRRARWLLTSGRAAPARVTRLRWVHDGHHRVRRVEFEFPLLSGARRTGRFDARRNAPEPGSTVTILYDPDRPGRNARYPLSLVRVS